MIVKIRRTLAKLKGVLSTESETMNLRFRNQLVNKVW